MHIKDEDANRRQILTVPGKILWDENRVMPNHRKFKKTNDVLDVVLFASNSSLEVVVQDRMRQSINCQSEEHHEM